MNVRFYPSVFRPFLGLAAGLMSAEVGYAGPEEEFSREILPILEERCFDCHGDGAKKGGVSFDHSGSSKELLAKSDLWVKVLKNVRAGLMPPPKEESLTQDEQQKLQEWIKRGALKLDPQHPDPGRVTLRRLNRVEYRNTINDLMGIDFRTDEEFPADDTGYGFDTIGDVLTTSPLLLEKYMQAAEAIVAKAVPLQGKVFPERKVGASEFTGKGSAGRNWEASISLYDAADLSGSVKIEKPGTYRLILSGGVLGSFAYDPGRAKATWTVDGKTVFQEEVAWRDYRRVDPAVEMKWQPGTYPLKLTLEPLVGIDQKPAEKPGDGPPSVEFRFSGYILQGPLEPEFAVNPPNYTRFFPRETIPAARGEREAYAREILRDFTTRAFRRPVDDATVERLVKLAMQTMQEPGVTFEKGVARSITAVLASPRFLFRVEDSLPGGDHPLLDEYALASRLSYFLWSTMPDVELFDLAKKGELRKNLHAQVKRMLEDKRSDRLVENFAGQWLQTRDVEGVSIDPRVVITRDSGEDEIIRKAYDRRWHLNQELDKAKQENNQARVEELKAEREKMQEMFQKFYNRKFEFSGELRTAMRKEAEGWFRHLMRNDLSVLKLIDSDETFLNETLASHYGVPGVRGREMRLVKLPAESPRGGVLTMGAVLAVTSNPTRTSPVKRGLFILDNLLGTPPPPAPPDVPSLEASQKSKDGRTLSLREALALHREQPLCSSCHDRMDPLGLALENFNAMGTWRDKEGGLPIERQAGKLITGETFADVKELKRVITTARRDDFYRCLVEKMLTYAIGRGPEPCDILTIDQIVNRLDQQDGRFSALLLGIIESPAFQQRRKDRS